jgi:chloride channel 2
MPALEFVYGASTTARAIQSRHVVQLTRKHSTVLDILLALNLMPGHNIPIVHTKDEPMLLGCVSPPVLQALVNAFYTAHDMDGAEADGGESATFSSKHRFSHTTTFDRLYCETHSRGTVVMATLLAQHWSPEKRRLIETSVLKIPQRLIQPCPITVTDSTSLEDIHTLFIMMRIDHCYVTTHGWLTGVITTKAMFEASKSHHPMT